jgi:hypothetical protein
MKTYDVEYIDQNRKIVGRAKFEAKNLKEARKLAQLHKKQSLEIKQAGRVKTSIYCLADVEKKLEKVIRATDEAIKEYDEWMGKV